ncbi:hypothetical protein ELI_2094 [Eubacterium callanderi]|uniref:Uncharacterized protein n=1 Tax=Eubacterium callanderi TaxID=53442 RepID=E3GML4_9FIRM|nr:hypothetical protein ELI_2094 [Eubacterium callanderi]
MEPLPYNYSICDRLNQLQRTFLQKETKKAQRRIVLCFSGR